MTKPMLVTTPFLLLLLDAWPLQRLRRPEDLPALLFEKLPFFALALASSLVAYLVQDLGGGVKPDPWSLRVATALTAYVRYLAAFFCWRASRTMREDLDPSA